MPDLRPVSCSRIEWRIYAKLDGTNWTDISRDVLEDANVTWDRGIDGGGPDDRTARPGTLSFALNNSQANSAGILGYYSTGHPSCRLGWDVGTMVRLDVAVDGLWKTQWIGRVDDVLPEHGILGTRRAYVTAKDWMEEAAEHNLKGLVSESDATAEDVFEAILDAIPIDPPGGSSIDTPPDTFPLVFDDIRDGHARAISEIAKMDRSALSYTFPTREGVLRNQSRNSRIESTQNLFVLNGTMEDVQVGRRRSDIINRIEVTVHPRRVGEDIAVLFSLEDRPLIAPGQTLLLRGSYTDPEDPSVRVGGTDMQTPLVAGQDYLAALEPEEVSGTPDTPAVLVPNGAGFHAGAGGSAADLADDNDNTGDQAEWGHALEKRSWTLTDVDAEDNAAVTGVRITVRVKHDPAADPGSSGPGFFVLYPGLRLNGIDLALHALGTTNDHFGGYDAGMHEQDFIAPLAPGGQEWNIAGINSMEFWRKWNWGGGLDANPILTEVSVSLIYASTVELTDRTSDLDVDVVAGGNSAEFSITNNGTDGVYLNRLQIRGRPVFEDPPVTGFVEDADSIAAYGEKQISIDMPYEADIVRGREVADYLLGIYGGRRDRADQVRFLANLSDEHMHHALEREIGDRIGMSEEVTGLSAFTAAGGQAGWHIQRVAGEISPGPVIRMTWGLAPADDQPYWHVGVEGQGEVGVATYVGPM